MAWDSSSFCKAFADMRRASSSRALVKEKERHAVAPQELPTEARQAREAQIERSHRLSFVAFHLTGPFGPSEVAGAWLRGPGCRKQAPLKRLLESCLRQLRREVHRLSMELEKCPSDASKAVALLSFQLDERCPSYAERRWITWSLRLRSADASAMSEGSPSKLAGHESSLGSARMRIFLGFEVFSTRFWRFFKVFKGVLRSFGVFNEDGRPSYSSPSPPWASPFRRSWCDGSRCKASAPSKCSS